MVVRILLVLLFWMHTFVSIVINIQKAFTKQQKHYRTKINSSWTLNKCWIFIN